MFIVTASEGAKIKKGEKVDTLRPIKAHNKGYFKVGSLQEVKTSRNFKEASICRVLVLSRGLTSLDYLTQGDILRLGYLNKGEYLAQPYNQANPSRARVKYSFIELSHLLAEVQALEMTPANLFDVFDMVADCRELMQGVNPALIFDGCDIEDLEGAFMTIESNIEEFII